MIETDVSLIHENGFLNLTFSLKHYIMNKIYILL